MVISCGLVEKERMIIKAVEMNHGLCPRYNCQIEGFPATIVEIIKLRYIFQLSVSKNMTSIC